MAGLGGLGYIAGGVASGLDEGTRARLAQLQAQQMQQGLAGQGDAGAAIMQLEGVTPPTSMVPGATPTAQSPMSLNAPAPGVAPPQAPPSAQPAPQAPPPPQQPQQGASAVPPQLQKAAATLDFPTLASGLAKMPGMTPQRLMSALQALQPFMNLQAQQQYKQATLQVAQQRASDQGANIQSEIQDRGVKERQGDQRLQMSQERLDIAKSSAAEKLQAVKDALELHRNTSDKNAQLRALSIAETNFRGLMAARSSALIAAGNDANDPTVKEIDAQLATARQELDAARAEPAAPVGAQSTGKEKVIGVTDGAAPAAPAASPTDKLKGAMTGDKPVQVKTPEEAQKLKPGTLYVTPDGQTYTR